MNFIKNFLKEEDGVGVVEIILILVVLIGLVIVFKENLESLAETIYESITEDSDSILN